MRRTTAIVAFCAAVVLAASAFAAHSAMGRATPAAGAIHGQTAAAATGTQGGQLARQLARARLATARYATDLRAAKADGYQVITRMIPDMGWHYLNPTVKGFDVTRPHILVYERHRHAWQLGALEWRSPETGARFTSGTRTW